MIQLPEFLFFFSQYFTEGNHIAACTHSKLKSKILERQAELEKKEKSVKKGEEKGCLKTMKRRKGVD